jgi:RNA polymerase sigma-70 factor (ECF subfamily)
MSQAPAPADSREFTAQTEPFRRELLAHCYRMLGSLDDAEDMVQETYLRAWRSYAGFEGRSSMRTWLYKIATNACTTALQHRPRRPLPSGLGGPGEKREPALEAGSPVSWLQPVPDALLTSESGDPAAVAVSRESLRLALIASLQYLPARQRAVLILRDVLAFSADESAAILGTTTVAVKSSLQRARARLREASPTVEQVTEPTEPEARAVLDRYVTAFENADAAALKRLLRADAALELLPSPVWYAGDDAVRNAVGGLGSPGDWRMIPTAANGQPAAAAYRRADGAYLAYGIVVLTTTSSAITRITVFADPGLLAPFGFPLVHPAMPDFGHPPAARERDSFPDHCGSS